MILVTGSTGKIGSALIKILLKKKIKFVRTERSLNYKKIDKYRVRLNLLNENHLKKIFNQHNITQLIHLAVTRNPLHVKSIRDFSTLKKDTLMIFNILRYSSKIKSIVYTSSGAVYSIVENKYMSKREAIVLEIVNFLKKQKKPKLTIKSLSNIKFKNKDINPTLHENYNKRLNGSSKLINELILISYSLEKKIPLFILRPFYVIETSKEIEEMRHKIHKAQKK